MKAESPPVVFTGPISQYLNPILALSAQRSSPVYTYASSPLRTSNSEIQRDKDSPERVKSPPRPISPPRPYTSSSVPAGMIVSRKQLQLVSVSTIQSAPMFTLLQESKLPLLLSLSTLKSEPAIKEAEVALLKWAALPETSAFEYGSGRVLQPQDCREVIRGTTGEGRITALRAVDILTKVNVGPNFVAMHEECEKLAKVREDYFGKLKLFVTHQSRARRERSKANLGIDVPFLVPGPGLEDSKHTACLNKSKRTKPKSQDSKPQNSLENEEFKLQMMKNIYEKQLLKVTFRALSLEHHYRKCLNQRVEEVQEKALMQVAYLSLAGWVHVMLAKAERRNILEEAHERLTALRIRTTFATLVRYANRNDVKQAKMAKAVKMSDFRLKSHLIVHLRAAILTKKRHRVLREMSDDHARLCLLASCFREMRDFIISTLVIKEKITQRTRLHSPARSDKSHHAALVQERMQVYRRELKSLATAPRNRQRNRIGSPIPPVSQAANETMRTPRLQTVSPQESDPVLAKYLMASQHPTDISPQAQTLQIHQKYAEHKQRFSPAELDPPFRSRTPEYWPVDVGLMPAPLTPTLRHSPFQADESPVESTVEESVDSLPSLEFRIDVEPKLSRERLVMQIRSLWLYYRTLKRVGPTFHTLRARKRLASLQPEDLIKVFIYSRKSSKFFTSWKRAYLTRYLLRHLEVFSSLTPARLALKAFASYVQERKQSDSRASFMYEQKLKQMVLMKWTSCGRVSDETLRRFRIQRALNAWKSYQNQIAEKLIATIKARQQYQKRLQLKALFAWDRVIIRQRKQRFLAVRVTTVHTWRHWLQKTRTRRLLKRVIAQGLENYKDTTIQQLRSDANLLTNVVTAWRKLSCKKRKSRESQLKTLTATNWRSQKTKVLVFFKWHEQVQICKGAKKVESYWNKQCARCLQRWRDTYVAVKRKETDVENYHASWVLQRVVEKWGEWVLQEKIVRALRRRRVIRAWRAGVYQVKEFPKNYKKRRAVKSVFQAWRKDWSKTVKHERYAKVLDDHNEDIILRTKRRVLAKFIGNWLGKSKSRRLNFAHTRNRMTIAFHRFTRSANRMLKRYRQRTDFLGKMRTFRLKAVQRIKPQIRMHYLSEAFHLLKQRYTVRKRTLSQFSALPLSQLQHSFTRILCFSQSRTRNEETLKFSSRNSEFDSIFRSLEDTYMKSSLYRDTRPRKVRFEGEIDTSSVGPKMKEICEEAQESWLDKCQRREQEKRAEIHRELDSLQASLMSSLSSKGSRSGRFDLK